MKPCCHLHIGTAKTGTTSIQSFLQLNRQRLSKQGYYFPQSLGSANHEKLVAYALAASKVESKRQQFSIFTQEDLKQFRLKTATELAREMRSLPSGIKHVVLSNEHCHSRLMTLEEVQTLKQLLDNFFDPIRVVVYLRRQDQAALSLYNTRILSGSSSTRVFPPSQPELPLRFDHARCLGLYGSVFGHDNIIVRLYNPQRLSTHPLVHDFAQAIGMNEISGLKIPPRLNTSLRDLDLQFLRILNLALEQAPVMQPARLRKSMILALKKSATLQNPPVDFQAFFKILETISTTIETPRDTELLKRVQAIQNRRPITAKGLTTRWAAKRFYSHFKSGNMEVARQYLPRWTGPLFDETFHEYT